MKSVLISIKPKWCELIANGKKTIEVRKTRPKIEIPFKVYIYCTQARNPIRDSGRILMYEDDLALTNRWGQGKLIENPCGAMMEGEFFLNGKVIGEFVCRNMTCMQADIDSQGEKHLYNTAFIENQMCLTDEELFNYIYDGKRNIGWAWGISDLVIYDKPKELSEFVTFCDKDTKCCLKCRHYLFDSDDLNGYRRWCDVYRRKPLTRPPQSWCYVKEVEE